LNRLLAFVIMIRREEMEQQLRDRAKKLAVGENPPGAILGIQRFLRRFAAPGRETVRILTLNYEYPPLGGGGGVAAANLTRELVRRGHAVDYVTSRFAGAARTESLEGVRLYRENVWKRDERDTATIASMLSYPPAAIWRGWRLARRNAYDIIHTHFAIPTGPAGVVLSSWLRLPNVLSVYGGDIYDPSKSYSPHAHPLLERVVRSVLDRADLVVPESTELAQRTAEIYGTRSAIQVVPLGFAPPEFEKCPREELGLHDGRTYAISVSRLVARKAYADLLHALRIADLEDLELLLIGSGPEESALRRLAVELGIEEKVHFLGHQEEARHTARGLRHRVPGGHVLRLAHRHHECGRPDGFPGARRKRAALGTSRSKEAGGEPQEACARAHAA
jgi:glycosyltransferase involved in cell wall biosynthesis